jgi:hypothetical protein
MDPDTPNTWDATWQITSGFPYAKRLRASGVPVTLIS